MRPWFVVIKMNTPIINVSCFIEARKDTHARSSLLLLLVFSIHSMWTVMHKQNVPINRHRFRHWFGSGIVLYWSFLPNLSRIHCAKYTALMIMNKCITRIQFLLPIKAHAHIVWGAKISYVTHCALWDVLYVFMSKWIDTHLLVMSISE